MKKVSMLKELAIVLHILALCVFFIVQGAMAAGLVSGHYVSSSGKIVELSLEIKSPPPASLILEQYLPPGTEIIRSQPKFKKYSIGNGEAKWLLKDVSPGKMSVRLELADKVAKGGIRALIRYKDPASGEFVESTVLP